ncbi:Rieske (2Fe-2S) protein [Mycobacterium pseudokansasii]|uniref:Rieske (2Fe-2S) protein n=1 Tax=Mycobacterium pseudokansasii TaxID=2341080 RepID=UPI003C6D3EB3
MHGTDAENAPVLLVRHYGGLHAIHNRCSHRGCLLSEGKLEGAVFTCPCQGSQFDVRVGTLVRGPATASQPGWTCGKPTGASRFALPPGLNSCGRSHRRSVVTCSPLPNRRNKKSPYLGAPSTAGAIHRQISNATCTLNTASGSSKRPPHNSIA